MYDAFKLHHALKEALCLRYFLKEVLEFPDHYMQVSYDELNGSIKFVIRLKASGKEFTIGVPDPYVHTYKGARALVPAGQFVEDWDYAIDTWLAARPWQRRNMWGGSYARRMFSQIIQCIEDKGIKVHVRTKPFLSVVDGGMV